MKLVKDVMNKKVVTISPNETFDKVINIMKDKKIGKLPVIDEGKIVGVLTREDLLVREENPIIPTTISFLDLVVTLPQNKQFAEKLKKFTSQKVKDLMSKKFITCKEEDILSDVVTKIIEDKYDFALVVDGEKTEEKLIGIVTKTDLISKCF